ncbi:MAG: tripartite tricarboxylate transporter substrate binding protein [Candidatus Marsarchaeota archaeon]|nr:tripartite tricarboxylate transporter substrate binding protein [Candidatus Marsarchaeota archaeon]
MRSVSWLLTATLFLSVVFLAPTVGSAASFPERPITLIVPYPAGGSTDVAIRALAEVARKNLGQPVIVENKSGGGGAVGVGSIVGKAPDGYLLAVAVTSLHRSSYLNKLSFDTVKDLTPIIRVGGYLYGILVNSDSQIETLADLIARSKANPEKLTYMASGVGTGGHVAMEELAYNTGVKVVHIPSKGDQESCAAVLGGHIDFISTTSGWVPLAQAGKLRILALFSETRTKTFPDAPTVAELGYKVVHSSPFGIFGPKGMPPDVVKSLHDAFKKSMEDPEFLAVMEKYELPVMYQSSSDYAKYWSDAYVEAGDHVKRFIKKE